MSTEHPETPAGLPTLQMLGAATTASEAPVTPWGYNGLGEIVYLRTYARPVVGENRLETWPETIERVIMGARGLNARLTGAEEDRLREHMLALRGTVSGRALWMLGTKMVETAAQDALNNCLAGETEVVTAEGIRPIGELAGGVHTLQTTNGSWVEAPVRSFGVQELFELRLRRGKGVKTIRATAEHGWFVYGTSGATKGRKVRLTTSELVPGNRLVTVRGQGCLDIHPSSVGMAHGIVYGDGTTKPSPYPTSIELVGDKNRELLRYFPEPRISAERQLESGVSLLRVNDLPRAWRSYPDLNESKSYLYGWLAGYFAADGHITRRGQATITSAKEADIAFVRDLCVRLGIAVGLPRMQMRSGFGRPPSAMHTIGIDVRTVSAEFFALPEHRARFLSVRGQLKEPRHWRVESVRPLGVREEVFCATVEETGAFALADNILTSNCYFTSVTRASDFRWIMDRLMVGGGVGFSVERSDVYQFPVVREVAVVHERSADADFIVPDTRGGWSELVQRVVEAHFSGHGFTYSTIVVRSAGAPLNTFGGTASGPNALIDGVTDICRVMCARAGKRLRSIDVLDIANIIGRVVVAGSARRSAQIALGDPDDALFLRAKRWASGNIPAWRANSNNTIIVDHYDEIADDPGFWRNFDGGSEPYGLFNRRLARAVGRTGERRPDPSIIGGNPCLEIALSDKESCNLATVFLPSVRRFDEYRDLSAILYKIQKATALSGHPSPESQAIIHKNLRLGQSVAGILQASDEQRAWLDENYRALRALDAQWSRELGVRESIRLTAVQPNGTLGLVGGVTPGIHGAYARHYIRRVRFGASDPLVDLCRQRGYPVVPEVGLDGRPDHSRLVVEFPAEAPEGTPLASEMTAVEQLEWVSFAQRVYADNAVSVTVTFRQDELPAVRDWLAEHYDSEIKSVSFLPYSDHGFALAPYEPIDEAEYRRRVAKVRHDGPMVVRGETTLDESECATGACPVR